MKIITTKIEKCFPALDFLGLKCCEFNCILSYGVMICRISAQTGFTCSTRIDDNQQYANANN